MPHPTLRMNDHERNIFNAYLDQRDISINNLFNQIVELKKTSTADEDEAERKWGDEKRLCPFCVVKVVTEKLFEWWKLELAKGYLDGVYSVINA
jgi:hypothetical protein